LSSYGMNLRKEGKSNLPVSTIPFVTRIEIRGYHVGRAYGTLKWCLGNLKTFWGWLNE